MKLHSFLDLTAPCIRREKVLASLSAFLKSDSTLFVLLGEAGTGKSWLLASFAESLGEPGVFLPGSTYVTAPLNVASEVTDLLASCLPDAEHRAEVGAAMHATGLRYVTELARAYGSCLLVIVDAVDETGNLEETLECVFRLSSLAYGTGRTVRFLLSCRKERWSGIAGRLTVPRQCLFMAEEPAEQGLHGTFPPYSGSIGDFDVTELKAAVASYRSQFGFRGELTREMEEVCRRPLLLRLAAAMSSRRKLPYLANVWELWDAYWDRAVGGGPPGCALLAEEVAEAMRARRATELKRDHLSELPSYNAPALHHLVGAGVLREQDGGHRDGVAFWHECLLEYVLARCLMRQRDSVLTRVEELVQEGEAFPAVLDALCILAQMVDRDTRLRLLRALAGAGREEQQLACQMIGHGREATPGEWRILEALLRAVPTRVSSALAEVGHCDPQRALRMLSDAVGFEQAWSPTRAYLFGSDVKRLCVGNPDCLDDLRDWLEGDSRHRATALWAFSLVDRSAIWPGFTAALSDAAGSTDQGLRKAAASGLPNAARCDRAHAHSMLLRLAQDPSKEVREELGARLWDLARKDQRWWGALESLAGKAGWRAREVGARACGFALSRRSDPGVVALGRAFARDDHSRVRYALANAVLWGTWYSRETGLVLPLDSCPEVAVPLVEEVVLRASTKELEYLQLGFGGRSASAAELVTRWSKADKAKLRTFAAMCLRDMWGEGVLDIAFALSEDRSCRVRTALAETLGQRHRRGDMQDAWETLEVVRGLLVDAHVRVRLAACFVLREFRDLAREEIISLLQERAALDEDAEVRCRAMAVLVQIGAVERADVRLALIRCLERADGAGPLTTLGLQIGGIAAGDDAAFAFMKQLASGKLEVHQHVATAAMYMCWLTSVEEKRKADECMRMLEEMIRAHACRVHFMAFAWLVITESEDEWNEEHRKLLPGFAHVLRAGAESASWVVRMWSVWAAWQCFNRYPSLRECAGGLLRGLTDEDARVRFAYGLYGGAMLAAARDPHQPSFLRAVMRQLLRDKEELVRRAACFCLGQVPAEMAEQVVSQLPSSGRTDGLRALVQDYGSDDADTHLRQLLAEFYCKHDDLVANELAFDIDCLKEDGSALLLAMWYKEPDKVVSIAEGWRQSRSEGLRKTARGFFKKLKAVGGP